MKSRAVAVLAIVTTAAACGAPAQPQLPASTASDAGTADAATDGPASRSDEPYATLDELAARGPTDAPLMREVLRIERAAPRAPDVRADRDLCLRALFAAPKPVRAWFADAAGTIRGDATSGAAGAVPPRGPVCARKGETLHLVIESAGGEVPAARAVIFAAP